MTTKPNGITPEELATIRKRAEKATPGPWHVYAAYSLSDITPETRTCIVDCVASDGTLAREDAEFIAHAREDIPRLLDEIERLQRVIAALDDEGMFRLGYVEWDEIWQGVRERLKESDAE
jgi:Ead/Ea22-like protein